jgi:spermidine synthase
LGLKNTAFVFGLLNLVVALVLFFVFWKEKIKFRKSILGLATLVVVILIGSFVKSDAIIVFGEQKRFKDKVVFVKQSKYQKMVITSWLDHHWLYINGHLQMTTVDEFLYHEPMIHPVMTLSKEHKNILIIGGGDGFNAKEILKYPDVETITLVDLDPEMTKLGLEYPAFVKANDSSLHNSKVEIINTDGFVFLQNSTSFYDVIVMDLPDAKGVDLNKLYTTQFYDMAYNHLRPNGFIVTQAGSPYYATRAFECINKTMQYADFKTLKLHNQVLSMGEWGWIIGSKSFSRKQMLYALNSGSFPQVKTRWINQESVKLITSFGKPLIDTSKIEINTINDPVLYQYQLNANWDLY